MYFEANTIENKLSTKNLTKLLSFTYPSDMQGLLWSYGSRIYNYLFNQCLSSLKLCLNPARARFSQYNIMW
jgi:hypothetical protein